MHFFSIVTTLAFASTAVLSAPINQANQTSAVSAITTILANLQSAIAADVASLDQAIQAARSNVNGSASVNVTATISTDLKAIAVDLQNAAKQIASATASSGSHFATTGHNFTQSEVNELSGDIQTAQNIASAVGARVKLTATNLSPAFRNAVASESAAVKALLEPFIAPLSSFAQSMERASASAHVSVTGLSNARSSLSSFISNLVSSIGFKD